jgi:nucleotide-binding universal stress UspA family protein
VLAKHGVVATAIQRNGQAADAILTCAEKENVDLIVLGARGAGAVTRILLGSTSDAVVSYSESSVWVVRPQSGKSDSISPHVTVGYDGSEASKRAIEFVRSLELPSECEISLLALVRRPENLPEEIQYDHSHTQALAKDMEELKKQFSEEGAKVTCVVGETTHVGHGIVDFAERNHSALVVVGDKGRSAIARFFLGSISRYVLHHAMCSVLVVKDLKSERVG